VHAVLKSIFAPSTAVMGRMKYLEKFLLISVLLIIPLGTVMYAYITDANSQIDFTRSELDGTRYLRPVFTLMADVLQARSAAREPHAAGLPAAQKTISGELAALEAVDADLGDSMKTTDTFAAAQKSVQALQTGTPDDSAFGAAVTDLEGLIAQVGDASNLILDPALDSYYVMDTVVVELPSAEDTSSQMRVLLQDIAARQSLTADDKASLRVLAGSTQDHVDAMTRGVGVASANTSDATLKGTLAAPSAAVGAATQSFLAAASTALDNPTAGIDSASKAISAQFALQTQATDALDRLLQARIDDYLGRTQRVELLAGAALALVLYLYAGFYLSVAAAAGALARAARQLGSRDMPAFAAGMRALSDGDLSHELTIRGEHVNVPGRDELGRIAADFNLMIDSLHVTGDAFGTMTGRLNELVGRVRDSAISLAQAASELDAITSQTGAAVHQVNLAMQHMAVGAQDTSRGAQDTNVAVAELTDAIQGIASGASEQARQVQAANDAASQMADTVEQVARRAQAMAATSEHTLTSAATGAAVLRETVTGMAEIGTVVTQAAARVRDLGGLGDRIGAIVATIDGIAEQTNLLALNAAIEAARAGEHGKGFAVVADEVRKLAERSSRETRQIADLINQVQIGTREAVAAMDAGSARVDQGASRAEQAGDTLSEIVSAVEGTVKQVTEIAAASADMSGGARSVTAAMRSISVVVEQNSAATEHMAAQSGQVSIAVQGIAAVSEEQSAATEEVSASAEELGAHVEQMTGQAQALARTASELEALVERFKLHRHAEPSLSEPPATLPLRRAA